MGSMDLAVRTDPEGTEDHRRRGLDPRGSVEPLWLGMRRVSEHLFEYEEPSLASRGGTDPASGS
jgi:hypothetical protein